MHNTFTKFLSLLTMLTAAITVGCVEEDLQNIVVTEDVIYISGDFVRLTGRVLELKGSIDDHGFQIDDNPEFSSPEIVSLGTKENGLGRFIGEYDQLTVSTNYYYRSYMNVAGEESVGQPNEFKTLAPNIETFYPPDAGVGTTLFIYGNNFTQDSRVKFGDREVEVVSIEEETEIRVRVPAIADNFSEVITVVVQDTSMSFATPFNYHYGRWQEETQFFDNTQIYEALWLKDGNDFVVGLGAPDAFSMNNKIWKLNLTDYSWSELAYPGADFAPARQPFNAGIFFGSGDTNFDANFNAPSDYFWRYNDGSFEQRAALPFQIIGGVAHIIDNRLYVFGGLQSSLTINTVVFAYNEANDTWDIASVAPIEITQDYPSFQHDNQAYFLQEDGNLWRFDQADDTWTVVSQFVDDVNPGGTAAVLDGKAYLGLFSTSRQLWEWDIATNTWIQKSIFDGSGVRDVNLAAFAHDNKVFFFRSKFDGGVFEPDPKMELWSFDPNQLK